MKKVKIPLILSADMIEKLKDARYIIGDENSVSGYSFTKEGNESLMVLQIL